MKLTGKCEHDFEIVGCSIMDYTEECTKCGILRNVFEESKLFGFRLTGVLLLILVLVIILLTIK